MVAELPFLTELFAELATKWKSIGDHLGIPAHQLDIIQAGNQGHPHVVQNCLREMFSWWINNGEVVTAEKLAQALHAIGEHGFEVKVKKTFSKQKTYTFTSVTNYTVVCLLYIDLSLTPCLHIDKGRCLTESSLPDFIQRYCYDIRMRYIQQSVLPESDWPPSLGGRYIRLALINQGRTTRDFTYRTVVELQEDYVRGKYDKILKHKTEIQLKNIFDPVLVDGRTEVHLRMLIDGAPGVGKTTLSRNVSQKWAEGKMLQEYWLVILLHLRECDISEAQTIDDFFYHDDRKLHDAVVTFIKEISGKGMLFIFDGYNELSLTERSKKSLFLDIIRGKILSECAVVVTSRPYASRPVQELQSVNRHVEILGFTDEQIQECIKQRIDDEAKAEELRSELEDRLDITSICQIPLNCSIVLYVYEQEGYQLPDTLTELYELFILHSLKRYATRTQDTSAAEALQDLNGLPSPLQEYFDILSKIAFDGLKEDRLVYAKRDIEQAFFSQAGAFITNLPVLDLMTSAKSYSSRGSQDTYSFLHLTIQEYLSAFWAANHLSETEKLDFLRQNVRNDRFFMVLLFFSGITKLRISGVQSVFDCDLWKYHHVHACHLLYESDNRSHSLYSYVANHCIPQKEITIAHAQYSRFDTLVTIHFLAYSNCQWNCLKLNIHQVQTLLKMFWGLNSCHTFIKRVDIEFNEVSICEVAQCHTSLLNELSESQFQIGDVRLLISLTRVLTSDIQIVKNNLKRVLSETKVVDSVYVEVTNTNYVKDIFEAVVECLAHNSTINNLELGSLTVENFEYVMSLLIKWNSNLNLTTLSVYKAETRFCHQPERYAKFFTAFSKYLAKNTSIKQINFITMPLNTLNCIDIIWSGLKQNSTLEELTIGETIVFRRNYDTSLFELVKGHEQCQSSSESMIPHIATTVSQCLKQPLLGASSVQTLSLSKALLPSSFESSDITYSFPSPAKRLKPGNSSRESL